MRQSIMFAVACGAIAAAAFACETAAAANAFGGSYCMSDREGRRDCSFATLAQCQASAAGTDAGCYARPQAGYAPPMAPAQSRRVTGSGGSGR